MSQLPPHPGQPTGSSQATADDLRKSGRFAEAVEAYAAVWPNGDRWTGWGYALALRKIKRSDEALRVAGQVLELFPDFERGRSVYSWAAFDTIRQADELSPELLGRAETVVKLAANASNAYEPVSPFVPTVLSVAQLLSRKGKHRLVLDWVNQLDPTRLGTDDFAFTDEKGKERKLASQRERYYALKTRALEKLERWVECLAVAQLALNACSPLHYDNDIWFSRRVARANINLGRVHEGISELERLATRKPASFIYSDIAEAYWRVQEHGRAFENCVRALQCPGEIGYKLAAIVLLARLLWCDGKGDDARRHLQFLIAYRRESGWRIGADVNELVINWGVQVAQSDTKTMLRELKAQWRQWSSPAGVRRSGVIQTLFPHGRAGFILAGDQQRFYFDVRDWKDSRRKLLTGSRVSFLTKPRFDRKHQRASVVAADITTE